MLHYLPGRPYEFTQLCVAIAVCINIQYHTSVKPFTPPLKSTRLLDQLRERLRYLHYSLRTEEAYVIWARSFVRWSGLRHPRDLGPADVKSFLTWLATDRKVSVSTQKKALCAIFFLYREVLGTELPWLDEIGRPVTPRRSPTVLTITEIDALLCAMEGVERLTASLLYGAGLRLLECLRLRIKDVDFERRLIIVRQAKGSIDRVVMLPRALESALNHRIRESTAI